jgi:hypothetical protein
MRDGDGFDDENAARSPLDCREQFIAVDEGQSVPPIAADLVVNARHYGTPACIFGKDRFGRSVVPTRPLDRLLIPALCKGGKSAVTGPAAPRDIHRGNGHASNDWCRAAFSARFVSLGCLFTLTFATFQVHFVSHKTGHSAEQTADGIRIWLTFETKILPDVYDHSASASLPYCRFTQPTG